MFLASVIRALPIAMMLLGLSAMAPSAARSLPARAGDSIRTFDTSIFVDKDASLDVYETVTLNFKNKHHGIVRFIPLTADLAGKHRKIYLDIRDVTCDGNKAIVQTSYENDRLQLRIGDSANELTGSHRYSIHYHVMNAVRKSLGRPEIYWNATGHDWKMPIEQATANVFPPTGLPVTQLTGVSFIGNVGSKNHGSVQKTAKSMKFSAKSLAPGQGLTITAQLPEGSVTLPGEITLFWWTVQQAATIAAGIACCFLGLWLPAILLFGLAAWRFATADLADWTSSGDSAFSFGDSGDGFGGGGGDCW